MSPSSPQSGQAAGRSSAETVPTAHVATEGLVSPDRVPVRRALVSVYDKTGLVPLAQALADAGVEIVSTGSTAATIAAAGLVVTPVEEITGFPECLEGRVKTLHPAVHAGILADRRKPDHLDQLQTLGVTPVDLVVVNLYPFTDTVASGAAAPCGLSIARPRAGWRAAGQGRSFGASGESFLRRRGMRARPSGRAERFQCSQRCGWHLRVPGGVRLVGDDGY